MTYLNNLLGGIMSCHIEEILKQKTVPESVGTFSRNQIEDYFPLYCQSDCIYWY